jgi:Fur family iron response transcriptional regulator
MTRKQTRDVSEATAARLRAAALRPTRQRVDLAMIIFSGGDRHLTAEALHDEACAEGIRVSLATVYNTLHQFTNAGLLRQVVVDASRSYFDTNTGEHQHFYIEQDSTLIDIPGNAISVANIPAPPKGTSVERVDIVVRIRKT